MVPGHSLHTCLTSIGFHTLTEAYSPRFAFVFSIRVILFSPSVFFLQRVPSSFPLLFCLFHSVFLQQRSESSSSKHSSFPVVQFIAAGNDFSQKGGARIFLRDKNCPKSSTATIPREKKAAQELFPEENCPKFRSPARFVYVTQTLQLLLVLVCEI